MKKYTALFLCLFIIEAFMCSCGFVRKPIDNSIGFSKYLKETEDCIRNENWEKAKISLENSVKKWKEVKPMFQIDIDHDYINDIENNFTLLKAYIDTKEKPDSLSLILLIQQDWETIGEM